MNYKFCQGTKITDPKILSYTKIASKFSWISALHFPHALGEKKNQNQNKNTTPPPTKTTHTHFPPPPHPNQRVFSPEIKNLKAQEQEGISSPYTAQDSKDFFFIFAKHKTSDHVRKRCLLLFSYAEDFGTAMKGESKHFLYGFFAYSYSSSPTLSPSHCSTVLALWHNSHTLNMSASQLESTSRIRQNGCTWYMSQNKSKY